MATKRFTLMIPGPSMPEPEVLGSLSLPTLPHYGSVWKEVHESAKAKLQSVFRTSSNEIIILPAPGQAAVEMAVANFVMRGEKAFVCLNGYFSEVIVEMIRSYGGIAVLLCNEVVRIELYDVSLETKPFNYQSVLDRSPSDVLHLIAQRLLRLLIPDKFQSDHETSPPDIPDPRMLLLKLLASLEEIFAHLCISSGEVVLQDRLDYL